MNFLYLLVGSYLAMANHRVGDIKFDKSKWTNFKVQNNKHYDTKHEELLRRSIFVLNKHQIDRFNEFESKDAGFTLDLNHLADLSELDMKSINGFRLPDGHSNSTNTLEGQQFLDAILNDNSIEVPDEVDWRKIPGRVSRVKNQGSCGSCWAFASTGALEGQEKKRAMLTEDGEEMIDELVELSEQNLVDCVTTDYGCNGGYMKDAFEFIKQEGGIDDETSYPYEGRTRKCRFNKAKVVLSDTGAAILPMGDEQKLKEVVAKFGPVAVAIDASSIWFQFYRHGVYYNKHCKNKEDQLDHGVLVVGYGTDPKKGDYWIVKNSWGSSFGENGYIRMARNRNNNCGIATVATIPTF